MLSINIQTSNIRPVSVIQQERQTLEEEKMSVGALGQELALEKIKGMQKDMLIQSLGQQVALLTLDVMTLKGGGN